MRGPALAIDSCRNEPARARRPSRYRQETWDAWYSRAHATRNITLAAPTNDSPSRMTSTGCARGLFTNLIHIFAHGRDNYGKSPPGEPRMA